jgi:hypothetical protein
MGYFQSKGASPEEIHYLHIPRIFFFFFVVLGFELKAYTLNHSTSPPFFLIDFLEIVSHKLFAQAVFEPIPRRNFMRNHSSHQQSWYS